MPPPKSPLCAPIGHPTSLPRDEEFDLLLAVTDALTSLADHTSANGASIDWLLDPALPLIVRGDLNAFQRNLNQFGLKALASTQRRPVAIDVRWIPPQPPGALGSVCCRLTGPAPDPSRPASPTPLASPPGMTLAPVTVIRQTPAPNGLHVILVGSPSRARNCLASFLHLRGYSVTLYETLPANAREPAWLLIEGRSAFGPGADSSARLWEKIRAGWQVAVYGGVPTHRATRLHHTLLDVVWLPDPPAPQQLLDLFPAKSTVPGLPRILVAEDTPENRLVLRLQLRRLGCSFRIVPDGAAAWAALQEDRFSVAILDLGLPEVDGLTLARRILAEMTSPPALVALTANLTPAQQTHCAEVGFAEALAKPLQDLDLARIIGLTAAPPTAWDDNGVWSLRNFTALVDLCGPRADDIVNIALAEIDAWLASSPQRRDTSEIARITHGLLGKALLIGAAELAARLKQIEELALAGSANVASALTLAEQSLERSRHELIALRLHVLRRPASAGSALEPGPGNPKA